MATSMLETMALALSLALQAAPASGAPGDEGQIAARRARLERERVAIEARYRAELSTCESRFTVTACTDDAKARRRHALEPIEQEMAQIDDAERRRRAAERLKRIEEKRAQAASRPAPPVEVVRKKSDALPEAATRAGPLRPPRAGASAPVPRPGAAQAYERRQREAEAHRRAVQGRNESRAAKRPPAPPLPDVPAGNTATR